MNRHAARITTPMIASLKPLSGSSEATGPLHLYAKATTATDNVSGIAPGTP